MLEVRSFDGSPEELSNFVVSQWTASYGGCMAVPGWSADYFRWQLRMDEPEYRRHIIAAYDGTQLAGVVPHFPVEFSLDGERFAASQASWLSVAPEFRGQGVAAKMIQGSRSLHRDLGLRFQLGFAYFGHQASQAPRFWLRSQTATTETIRKVGFWVWVLDPSHAVDWNPSSFQRWITRLTAPLCGVPKIRPRSNLVIRPAEKRDLPRCLMLADQSTRHCRLRLIWDAESMSRQLGFHGFSHALVAEEDGELRGCVTFYLLPMMGRTQAAFGIMDLVLVSELSASARVELLNSALLLMKQHGAIAALKLRVGDYPRSLFMRLGWIPRPSDSHVLVTWADEPQSLPQLRRIHVLWR
jgi:GNAT superfamily N-acetyltransferase